MSLFQIQCYNNKIMRKLLCLVGLLFNVSCLFSGYFRKCRISKGIDIGSVELQRVPIYQPDFSIPVITNTSKPLKYTSLDFIYLDYIASGGSGEVHLVEEEETKKELILKKFYKEKKDQFQQENFLMSEMGYHIAWHYDEIDGATIAQYEAKDSVMLRDFQLQKDVLDAPILFYKLCKEVERAHKQGIIHHDLKMKNVLVNYRGGYSKSFDVQLIDWNLASFYYHGYYEGGKKGTTCYYAPETLLRINYQTPAVDIWALAVMIFSFLTGTKPFPLKCKQNNFRAILSLVGTQKMTTVLKKYRFYEGKEANFDEFFTGISIRDRIPEEKEHIFTHNLINLMEGMLEPDPEHRLTISEVLNHPYFYQLKHLPKLKESHTQKQNIPPKDIFNLPQA